MLGGFVKAASGRGWARGGQGGSAHNLKMSLLARSCPVVCGLARLDLGGVGATQADSLPALGAVNFNTASQTVNISLCQVNIPASSKYKVGGVVCVVVEWSGNLGCYHETLLPSFQ